MLMLLMAARMKIRLLLRMMMLSVITDPTGFTIRGASPMHRFMPKALHVSCEVRSGVMARVSGLDAATTMTATTTTTTTTTATTRNCVREEY